MNRSVMTPHGRRMALCLIVLSVGLTTTPCQAFITPSQQTAAIPSSSSVRSHTRSRALWTTSSNDNSNTNNDAKTAPTPAQLESISENAKELRGGSSDNDTDARPTGRFWKATTAGMAVALAMIPEATAFAFVAGVSPLVGLWTTVVLGFTAASLGGRAGICSSASGACSIVVAALCRSHGPAYLSACAMLAGILQVAAGLGNLGRFIRLVPAPVMLGFVNGLAIVMTKAQLQNFRTGSAWLSPHSAIGASMYGVTALTMVLVKVLPKVTKVVPPSLGAVVLATIVAKVLKLPVDTLADVAGAETFRGGLSVLPSLGFPKIPWTWETLQIVWPYALTMAAVGMIESLLTLQLVDGMVNDGTRGCTSKECVGQGCGNFLSGVTGGIGGCALVGQSIINVQSGGGVSRWSGMSMALFLAAGIVAAAPLLGAVPVASLVGVMLLVCQSTFSWSSLRILRRIPRLDAAVIALVSILTVQKDLAVAVVAGTIASALGFAWKQSTTLTASTSTEGDRKLYTLNGPLFFGSTSAFTSLFDSKNDPQEVILDFSNSRVMDHSALKAIHDVADKYGAEGKTIYLRKLSKDCCHLLAKLYKSGSAPEYEIIEKSSQDPVYGLPVRYNDVKFQ